MAFRKFPPPRAALRVIPAVLAAGGALVLGLLALGGSGGGCAGSGSGSICVTTPNLDPATICSPVLQSFSTTVDNPYLPFNAGQRMVLRGSDDEGTIRIEIEVDDPIVTEPIDGVDTLVVTESEYEDGELVETSLNYYAQALSGAVCHFGSDVQLFVNGQFIGTSGSWRSDEGSNAPGLVMPASPQVGDHYPVEVVPGLLEDRATVTAMGASLDTAIGSLGDTVSTVECDPLEGGTRSTKIYAAGFGLVSDDGIDIKTFDPGS